MKEWRLLTREEIESVPGMQKPVPDSLFAVGAVDAQGVVCAIGCFLALCADPVWVREDYRGSPRLLLRLWLETQAEIQKRGGSGLRVTMTEHSPGEPTASTVARMCEFAGGEEVEGARVFLVPVR